MNNAQQTTDAEPEKSGPLTASIERMTACLEDVIANAKSALKQMPLMPRDGMRWMALSKAVFDIHERTRMGCVDPRQTIGEPASGTGAFFTKPEALEAILQNPPPDIRPKDEMKFTRMSLVNIPELNIEFHNFYTDDFYKAVCYWENKEGERRVYEITVKPWVATSTAKWRASAQVCGKVLFYLEASSKSLAIECALVAMRRYLIRSHRAAWRTYRKAVKAAACCPHPAPLSSDEELADTTTRQNEMEA